ncbi:MAG TPA: hypothetical protein VFE50_15680, partial [Cyclobacteriaceae bacterium]|nr:hypothetical protein [Cyclobacteriaceae bacterium]
RVDATVLSKKVDYKHAANGYHYSLKVEYKYLFESKEYVNDKVFLMELMGGRYRYKVNRPADKIIEDLGENVKIYVYPEMPSESVLFCSGIGWYIFVMLIGFILLLYCLVTLINML